MTAKDTTMQATATTPTRTEFGVTRQGMPIDSFLLRSALDRANLALTGLTPSMDDTAYGEIILATAEADTSVRDALFTVLIKPELTGSETRLLIEEPGSPAATALIKDAVRDWLDDVDPDRADAALTLMDSFIRMDNDHADAFHVLGAWLAWSIHDATRALAYLRMVNHHSIHARLATQVQTMVFCGVEPEQAHSFL